MLESTQKRFTMATSFFLMTLERRWRMHVRCEGWMDDVTLAKVGGGVTVDPLKGSRSVAEETEIN